MIQITGGCQILHSYGDLNPPNLDPEGIRDIPTVPFEEIDDCPWFFFGGVPSGEHTKSNCIDGPVEIVDFPMNSMVIFHCYVSSPEGTQFACSLQNLLLVDHEFGDFCLPVGGAAQRFIMGPTL